MRVWDRMFDYMGQSPFSPEFFKPQFMRPNIPLGAAGILRLRNVA